MRSVILRIVRREKTRAMLVAVRVAVVGAGVGMVSGVAEGGIVTWDGSCGGADWHSQCGPGNATKNWMPDVLPGLGDEVVIPAGSPVVQMTTSGGAAQEITVDSGLRIGNVTLQLGAGGGYVSNLDMDATFATVQFMTAGTELGLQGNCRWSVGTVKGDGTMFNSGSTINGTILTQAMTMQLQNGAKFRNESGSATTLRFLTIDGQYFENQAGATFTAHADAISGYIHNGVFTNAGNFVVNHATSSSKEITSYFNQTGGSFTVKGVPHSLNTYLRNGGQFTGGTIVVQDDCKLKFWGDTSIPYWFNGLTGISGAGNVYVETSPVTGSDWQVGAPLTVNMTGTEGLVINGRMTLGNDLTNTGKVKWMAGQMRRTASTTGPRTFINQSTEFQISGSPTLSTLLWNKPGARMDQMSGALTFAPTSTGPEQLYDALLFNEGEYRMISGSMQEGLSSIGFSNQTGGTFRRPNEAGTVDATISSKFANAEGATMSLEKAKTTFRGVGLVMGGGTMQVSDGATCALTEGEHRASASVPVLFTGAGRLEVSNLGRLRSDPFGVSGIVKINMTGTGANGFHLMSSGVLAGGSVSTGDGAENVGNMYWEGGVVGYQGSGWLHNSGVVEITNGGVNGASAGFINEANGDVRQLGGMSVNNGGYVINMNDWEIFAPAGNTTMMSGNGTCANWAGVIHVYSVNPPSTVGATALLSNSATVHVHPGVTLAPTNVDGLTVGALNKGTWIADAGGVIDFPMNVTEIGAEAQVVGKSASFPGVTPSLVRGKLKATGQVNGNNQDMRNEGETKAAPGPIKNPGKKVKNGGGGNLTIAYAYTDHEVSAKALSEKGVTEGFECTSFENEDGGVVRPGGPGSAGPFAITGDFNQFAGGTVQIEVGGLTAVTEHDQMQVTGNVTLGGLLTVLPINGFSPAKGQQFTVMTVSGGTITGQFAAVNDCHYEVIYAATSVVVTVTADFAEGDITCDGEVNIDDLTGIILQWGACQAPPAACSGDLNGNGMVDIDDLTVLILNWGP